MLPVLFYLGRIPVGTHDFFVLLGVAATTAIYFYEAQRRRMLHEQIIWIAIGPLGCGALAAKLSTAWHYLAVAPQPSLLGVLEQGGKSILGGLAGAYAGALLVVR